MQQNDMADAAASMQALMMRHNASLEEDPRKKQDLLQRAQQMERAVEVELAKKREGKIDTSWIHDKEEVKKRTAAVD